MFSRWDIISIKWRYQDDPDMYKQRPAVIKEIRDDGSVVLYVTSQVDKYKDNELYAEIDYKRAGLHEPSLVYVGRTKLITKEQLKNARKIGRLAPPDMVNIKNMLDG